MAERATTRRKEMLTRTTSSAPSLNATEYNPLLPEIKVVKLPRTSLDAIHLEGLALAGLPARWAPCTGAKASETAQQVARTWRQATLGPLTLGTFQKTAGTVAPHPCPNLY